MVDPPRPGLVLPELVDTTPLTEGDAATLYEAFVMDLCTAAAASGGDLLLNYRPDDLLPEEYRTDVEPQADVRAVATAVLSADDLEDTRFEVQVGSTPSARLGNTVTHLLNEEGVETVAFCDPATPLRNRTHIDAIAMKLRRSEVVLGPGGRGRTHTAGFREAIDFSNALTEPTIDTFANRADDAGLDVDFAPHQTVVETHDDLLGVVAEIGARQVADRWVPPATTQAIDELGIRIDTTGDEPRLVVD